MFVTQEINSNWTFSLAESSYLPDSLKNNDLKSGKQYKATVPGTIHTDLLNNGFIDDPFYSDNELKMGWIPECDWIYRTKFDYKTDPDKNVDLVFDGLDTICEIYLNDVKLGRTGNMFIKYSFNVKKLLKPADNILMVVIKSPVKYAASQEKKFGRLPSALNPARTYIRKAQYSFGWDWGPEFPTSGIWRKVYLQEWKDVRIENVAFNTEKTGKDYADVQVIVEINSAEDKNYSMVISLSNGDNISAKNISIRGIKKTRVNFRIKNPELWWPNGEGEQPLYLLRVKIADNNDTVLDEVQKKVGIRTISLELQEKKVSTFKFRVNNRDIFCKGANWIPADSFLPRVSSEKVRKLLVAAKEANMNIVRVWGGGVYESDEFYSLCDELGLLVWQDFLFACGSYPENYDFITTVSEEITRNIMRLQHHASLAIWCGNNENDWIWYQEQKSSYKNMPGYKIYHHLIPEILKNIDPLRPYWPSTPFGNEDDPNSQESGNTHQWDIWSRWIDYDNVINDRSLFVTEFGFQGPANKDTFEKYLDPPSRNISDRIFEHHNKQVEGPERVLKFLSSHLPVKTGWDDFLYLAQLNQGFALKTCLEYWRTNGRTNGSIIWQLNDCWPVTSWSVIDFETKPKMAYYFVKNAFAPELLHFKDDGNSIKIMLLNEAKDKISGKLRLTVLDATSGEIIKEDNISVNVKNKGISEITRISRENLPASGNWILTAVLSGEAKEIITRNYYLLKPWKHIKLKKSRIKLKYSDDLCTELTVTSSNPAFFIDLYHPQTSFSDRGFSLLPGEQVKVKITGEHTDPVKLKDIKIYSLNDYLNG